VVFTACFWVFWFEVFMVFGSLSCRRVEEIGDERMMTDRDGVRQPGLVPRACVVASAPR
jgi:hypothetical protein